MSTLKRGRTTQRLWLTASVSGQPLDLTGKTVEAKLAMPDESSPQVLAATIALPQTGGNKGRVSIDVTSAALDALSNAPQVLLALNVWNADNSLCLDGRGLFAITL